MASAPATLSSKLLRWLLIPLSVLFVVDAVGSYVIATRVADGIYDGELTEIARELALHIRPSAAGPQFDLSSAAERALLLDTSDKVYYAVRDASGRAVAGDAELAQPEGIGSGKPSFYSSVVHGDPVRVAALPLPGSDAPGQEVLVQVAETLAKRHALAEKIIVSVILPQLLLILIAGGVVWFGVARGLAPLRHLRQAVVARSHLDLSPVVAADVPGEIHPLLLAVNDLMARLSDVLSFQNRFIADAAHQLRTPVAGMKAHIEVALRENDLADTKRALAHLYTSVERLSRLVSQLLSLARNEPSTVRRLTFVPVDLNKLAFDVTTEWVPEAYKKNIDLGFEGADAHIVIDADAARLVELINNLLDNAIRYSRPGGRVTVRVGGQAAPHLSISDDGPTIPVAERHRVFERFHRLLGSQSAGTGLGLAIVREIAALHDAEIHLEEDTDGVGNTFTVSFPPHRSAAEQRAAAPTS